MQIYEKLSRSMYSCIFNSPPVIRTASAKNRCFHVPQPTFLFPLETPLRLTRNMLHGWKDNSMLAKPIAARTDLSWIVSELYNAKSMRKSKNRYFYHILVSPGDAPGAITLNVIWMEREFDAYKLSRWMCSSNSNRFWDRARYWSKIVIFSYPLHLMPPLGGFPSEHRHPVWCGKTRIVWLPDGEKISKTSLFMLAQLTNVTDRQTDGHRVTAYTALMHSIAR